jgi:uncharacterized protein
VHPHKYDQLVEIIRSYGSAVVALSGGADSTLLTSAAYAALGPRALAVTGASPSIPPRELEFARDMAQRIGIPHRVIDTKELEDENYRANPTNRCYFCKKELYGRLLELARSEGYLAVLSGDNLDDLVEYRPGRKAAVENGVRFPLQEAQLTKAEIRDISHALDLPSWDKPASPCLSSRVAYGEAIDPIWLERIDAAETFLRELGFTSVRVRHHRDLARIEVDAAQVELAAAHRELITARLKGLGWAFVCLDLAGFRSGSLNRVIPVRST